MRPVLAPLIDEYLRSRLAKGELTRATVRNTRYTLQTLAEVHGARPVSHLRSSIDRWLESIAHLAKATQREYLTRIRPFGLWLVRTKRLAHDPTVDVIPIRVPRSADRALDQGDVDLLLAVVDDDRGRALVLLMLGCGLRRGEVAGLEVADYDRRRSSLRVVGKGGHTRIVPVPVDVADAIARYQQAAGVNSGPLFRSEKNGCGHEGISPARVTALTSQWMYEAGIKARPGDGVSAHALRHTCASDVIDACHDVTVVRDLLGHASVATTDRYLRRARVERIRDAMERRSQRDAKVHPLRRATDPAA